MVNIITCRRDQKGKGDALETKEGKETTEIHVQRRRAGGRGRLLMALIIFTPAIVLFSWDRTQAQEMGVVFTNPKVATITANLTCFLDSL